MSPPKIACQVQANLLSTTAKLIEKVESISLTVNSIIALVAKVKYGILNFTDMASAELISAVSSIAANAAQVALGAISKASAALLEAILSSLLKILLAFPTAIFSLVAIPQDQAIDAADKERLYLLNAKANLKRIISIIIHWTNGFDSNKYYKQMINAIPYINKAFELCEELIIELEGSPTEDDSELNSRFNESKYNSLRGNILQAIEITKPSSVIVENSRITQIIEKKRVDTYQSEANVINNKYAIKKSELVEWYHNETVKNTPENEDKWGERLGDSLKLEGIKLEYATRLKALNVSKKEELAIAELNSSSQGIIDKSAYVESALGLAARFRNDMQVLSNELFQFIKNIKDAFLQYKRCQVMCNTIYNIEGLIKKLIGEIIKLLKNVGNGASSVIVKVLETSSALISFTHDKFEDNIDRYEDSSKDISTSEMSTTIVTGNGALMSANSALSASVTDSLIQLINSDDTMENSDDNFREFINNMANISDWDGKLNIWSVDHLNASVSPYSKLISDSTTMLAKIPKLAFSTDEEDRLKLRGTITVVNKLFKVLFAHNSEVSSVLYSYTPYRASETGDLKKILATANLLDQFALGMSITSLITELAMMNVEFSIDEALPTLSNCQAAYPDLYQDEGIQKAIAILKGSIPPVDIDKNIQNKREDNLFALKDAQQKLKAFEINVPEDEMYNSALDN